jgi:hypothetical protein
MKHIEYVLYRAARDLLPAADLAIAQELARQADAGDRSARRRLRRIVLKTVFTERQSKGKAAAA